MIIPQELLQCSEKELRKLLPENKYKATYLTNGIDLFTIKTKLEGFAIGVFNSEKYPRGIKLAEEHYDPLLYSDVILYKRNMLRNKLAEGDIPTFVAFLKVSIRNIVEKDNFEVTISGNTVTLILYFPELSITNTIGSVHTMKDLYVRFTFVRRPSFYLQQVALTRTTYSVQEFIFQYTFSHASGTPGCYTDHLCFGDNTIISKEVHNVKRGNITNLSYVFILFKEYLQWESIEGTPYRSLNDIGKGDLHEYSPPNTDRDTMFYTSKVLDQLDSFTYIYELVNGIYTIKLSLDSINYIDSYLTSIVPEKDLYFLVNGISVKDTSIYSGGTFEDSVTSVVFKGETKKLKLYDSTQNNLVADKRVHRVILKGIINTIEQKFNAFLINKLE